MSSSTTLKRYDIIHEKNPREILLLRGSGCMWRRCTFCDYHLDFSRDEASNYRLNQAELSKVSGLYHRLEIVNSGSFCELDQNTIQAILKTCKEKAIDYLHFEMHWLHKEKIPPLRNYFTDEGVSVTVKMGVETFDCSFREDILLKGMGQASPLEIAGYADEICLLFGIKGQTAASMKQDMDTGLKYFKRVCVNIMSENTTAIHPDAEVIAAFEQELLPLFSENQRVDILQNNTDFGVGGTKDE